jgi:hypothetical protein
MGAGGGGGGGGGCGIVVVDTAAAAAGLIQSLLLPRNPPGCWRRHLYLPRRGEPLHSLETESRISPLIRGDRVMSSQVNVAVYVPLCQVWAVITQRHMLAIHFCREEGQTRCENRNSCPGLRRVHIIACSCEMKLIIFRQKDKYLSRGRSGP